MRQLSMHYGVAQLGKMFRPMDPILFLKRCSWGDNFMQLVEDIFGVGDECQILYN
jgi:hypothetical protein